MTVITLFGSTLSGTTASSRAAGALAEFDSDVGKDCTRLSWLPTSVADSRGAGLMPVQVGKATRSEDGGGSTLGQHTGSTALRGQSLGTLPVTKRSAFNWASVVLARTGTVPPGPLVARTATGTETPTDAFVPPHPTTPARSNAPIGT